MANTIAIRREDLTKIGEQRSAVAPAQVAGIVKAGGCLLVQPAVHPGTGERKRIFEDREYAQVVEVAEFGDAAGIREKVAAIVGNGHHDAERLRRRREYVASLERLPVPGELLEQLICPAEGSAA